MSGPAPHFSVVIPVYNEEAILYDAISGLREKFAERGFSYEIIVAENGSKDATVRIGTELAAKHPDVTFFSLGEPNYGKAMKEGILRARGTFVVCEEIDLCDVDFHARALAILESSEADLVIGSKLLGEAQDDRPMVRHAASMFYNGLLRVTLGFRGTDTHGLKAFRRGVLLPLVEECVIDKDLFSSELVIRAGRADVSIIEIPIRLEEKRPPAINLVKRVPGVMKGLVKLTRVIRFGGAP